MLAAHTRSIVAGIVLALVTSSAPAQTFFDNFNGGADTGWTRYQPLQSFGAPGTWSFPSGGYRIQAAASPNPGTLGPGRAGSLRTELNYANFQLDVDVVAWDNSLTQAFGLGARVREVGLGTTDGYLFLYLPGPGSAIVINRSDNESQSTLAGMPVSLDPAQDYRFRLIGAGNTLTGMVFNLTDLTTPLATVTTNDGTYPTGNVGLLVAAATTTPGLTADATFDNFSAVPEPSSLALLLAGAGGVGLIRRLTGKRRVTAEHHRDQASAALL